MCLDAACHRAFGDASAAKVGNDGNGRLDRAFYWVAAWRAYRDPTYAWLFRNGQKDAPAGDPLEFVLFLPPEMPAGSFDLAADAPIGLTGRHVNACTLLPNGGFVVLRQDPSRDAMAAAITYGQYVNVHFHPDQLSPRRLRGRLPNCAGHGRVPLRRGSRPVGKTDHRPQHGSRR